MCNSISSRILKFSLVPIRTCRHAFLYASTCPEFDIEFNRSKNNEKPKGKGAKKYPCFSPFKYESKSVDLHRIVCQ